MNSLTKLMSAIVFRIKTAVKGGTETVARDVYMSAETLHRVGKDYPGLDYELSKRFRSTAHNDIDPDEDTLPGIKPIQHRTSPPFATIPMQERFIGEHEKGMSIWNKNPVKYYDEKSRQRFLLAVRDGKIYDSDGRLFDTTGGGLLGDGNAIFVMDEQGRFYASKFAKIGEFQHSSFLAGSPVAAAGTIKVEKGIIQAMSDRSGHYVPSVMHTLQALEHLRNLGVKLPMDKVVLYASE